MGEPAAASADGEGSESTTTDGRRVVNVAPGGDLVLDVTFETSLETLKKYRKAEAAALRKSKPPSQPLPARGSPRVRVAYRLSLEVLKRSSKYFANLLSNPQFREAGIIARDHATLQSIKIRPSEAVVDQLPWVTVVDDDEATKAAGREVAFEDMLRILHKKPVNTNHATMAYATTMAIIADRFDCVAVVARALNADLKFKWPLTSTRPMVDDSGRPTEFEQVLRQKILVSWLLGQPMRLQQCSRELIVRGSSRWSVYHEPETASTAAWWNLSDGIEGMNCFLRFVGLPAPYRETDDAQMSCNVVENAYSTRLPLSKGTLLTCIPLGNGSASWATIPAQHATHSSWAR